MYKKKDLLTLNRLRCINALILCTIVIVCAFIGVVIKLVAKPTAISPDVGISSFRYFTLLSNIFMAFTASLCIPFEIDGIRNHNYHLPRWTIGILYCGVCCIAVTFTVAVCILSPVRGVSFTLLQESNLYLHTIGPIAAMLLFILVNDDHNIGYKQSFFVLIPVLCYAFVYWLKVFKIGEANGGWRDQYYTNTYFPYWIALFIVLFIALSIANIIRVLHNKRHLKRKKETELYYMTSPDFEASSIQEAIVKLALREKKIDRGGEIIVPRRLIIMLEKRYNSDLPVEYLCHFYLQSYLK